VGPDDFIPLAEDSGLIASLGAVVLVEACAQVAQWNARRSPAEALQLSVNLSARQLARTDLQLLVADTLVASQLDPGLLALEITESTLMDADAARDSLEGLRRLGVQLVVDDFGTGYSSLLYLRRLPIDVVKVDKSFVSGLRANDEDDAIVAAVVSLARALDLRTVAEGVETTEQLDALRALGCEFGQGYLWGRPMCAAEAWVWLEAHSTAAARVD
jgi:EAL domain-containing protein (putative c-di-GMP-specific phosphodiesterase class I)